jgi:hypothetical protein
VYAYMCRQVQKLVRPFEDLKAARVQEFASWDGGGEGEVEVQLRSPPLISPPALVEDGRVQG